MCESFLSALFRFLWKGFLPPEGVLNTVRPASFYGLVTSFFPVQLKWEFVSFLLIVWTLTFQLIFCNVQTWLKAENSHIQLKLSRHPCTVPSQVVVFMCGSTTHSFMIPNNILSKYSLKVSSAISRMRTARSVKVTESFAVLMPASPISSSLISLRCALLNPTLFVK